MNKLMQNEKLTAAHMSEINNIDKTVTIGMISSENKLIKILHDILWSFELNRHSKRSSYTGASSNPSLKRRYFP